MKPTRMNIKILSNLYAGKYQDSINKLYTKENIKHTAELVRRLVPDRNKFEYGKLNRQLLPNRDDWGLPEAYDDWDKNLAAIPQHYRDELSKVVGDNLYSEMPQAMVLTVGPNVNETHSVRVTRLKKDGDEYIDILILCPNPKASP